MYTSLNLINSAFENYQQSRQRKDRQINNLDEVMEFIGNGPKGNSRKYFSVKGGYTMAHDKDGLGMVLGFFK